jgi:hypothetical protein
MSYVVILVIFSLIECGVCSKNLVIFPLGHRGGCCNYDLCATYVVAAEVMYETDV